MPDLQDLAESAAIATPEQIAEHWRAIGIPQAPDVRPAADELAPIPEGRPAFENTVAALAFVGAVLVAFLT